MYIIYCFANVLEVVNRLSFVGLKMLGLSANSFAEFLAMMEHGYCPGRIPVDQYI